MSTNNIDCSSNKNRLLTTFSCSIIGVRADAEEPLSLNIKPTNTSRLYTAFAPQIRHAIRQFDSVEPIQWSDPSQSIHIVHACVMRAIEYVHAHEPHRAVGREAARRRAV